MDFHYNGTDVSIEGNTQVLLSTLIAELGIVDEAGDPIDVAKVASVSFTDERLVTVEEVSGEVEVNGEMVDVGERDFLLTSNEPFTSAEQLIITLMDDGQEIAVDVTDAQEGYADLKSAATQGFSATVVDQGSSTATYNASSQTYTMQLKVDFQIPSENITGASGQKKYDLEFATGMKIPDEYLNRDMSAYDSVTGDESFRYRLVKDGDKYHMLVEYTDAYIASITESGRTIGNNTVTIDISVGSEQLQNDNSLRVPTVQDQTVTVAPNKITYPEGTDGRHDIAVSKRFGGYDKTTHKMKYTMIVSSQQGTEGSITVNDALTVLNGDSVTVSDLTVTSVKTGDGNENYLDNVTTPVDNYQVVKTGDNTGMTITLPQADAPDNNQKIYLIEYEYTLSNVGDEFESNGKNSATATSGNVTNSGEAYWNISQTGIALNKNGQYDAENGEIIWTIDVTNNKDSAIPLQDDAFKGLAYNDLTITPSESLSFDSSSGTITIPAGKSYTITYATTPTIPDPTVATNVTNTATAGNPGDGQKTVNPGVSVPADASVGKELVSTTRNGDDAVLTWRVRIHVPKTGFAAGTKFTDELMFNQNYISYADWAFFTDAQKDALVSAFEAYFGPGSLEVDYTPAGQTDDGYGNITRTPAKVVMTLKNDWSTGYNGQDIYIDYKTSADLAGLNSDNNGYDNTFRLNDLSATATHSFKERVVKLSTPGNAADETTTDADRDNKKLHWYIQVALEEDAKTVSVEDVLPEGLTVTAIRMGDGPYNLIGLTEITAGRWGGEIYADWRNGVPQWEGTYLGDSTPSATVNGQTVTISLTSDHVPDYFKANEVFYFYIEAEIDDNQFPASGTSVKGFTNTASVSVDGNPYGSDDQTQKVTLKTSLVNKTGDTPVWNAQNGAHELSYTVNINPFGGHIAGPDCEITLTDHIEYYKTVKDNQGNSHKVSLNLKEGSAKLQRQDANGQWVDIPATEGWGYILNEDAASPSDNIKAKEIEIFGIPDDMPLRFVYTYNVVVDGLPKNASVNLGAIKNTATLHAIVEESSSHIESKDWKNIQSTGTTESTGSMTVVKVQDGNYAIALPDTHFVLEVYDASAAGQWRAIDAVGSSIQGTGEYSALKIYRTNANGKLIISSDPHDLGTEGNFQYDTLYRVREYEPHEGYTLDGLSPEAVYFYFGKDVTPDNRTTTLAGFNFSGGSQHADDLLTEADTVYMTNKRVTDTITGRKQWNATSLWPNDVIEITLELQKNGVTVEKPSSYSVKHNGQYYTEADTGFTKPWRNPQVLTEDNPQALWENLDIDASAANAFEDYRIVETGIRYGEPGTGVDLTRETIGSDQYQWTMGSGDEVLFETFGGKVTNGMGTIVNMSKTSLDVEKSWGTQQLGNNSTIKVILTLQKQERLYAQNGVIEPTLPNWTDQYEPVDGMAPIVLDGHEEVQWQASFENLDRFRYDESTGRLYEIRYSVTETVTDNDRDITDRYLPTFDRSADGTKVTVTNNPNVGELAVVKEWQRRTPEDGETLPDLPGTIYISLERYYVDGGGVRHNDAAFNADHRGIAITAADTWQKDSTTTYSWAKLFENLQRQVEVDGEKYDYKYVVKEDNVPGFTKVIEGDDIALHDGTTGQVDEVTVTNVENESQYVPELIDLHLKKQFTDEYGTPLVLPEGATATFRLYRYITVERGYYDLITKALTPEETIPRMEDIAFNDAGNDEDWTHVLPDDDTTVGQQLYNDGVGVAYSWYEDEWTNLPISEIYYNNGAYVKNTYEYYLVERSATDGSNQNYTPLFVSDGSKDRPITAESSGTEVDEGNDIKNAQIWNVKSDKTLTVRKYWYGLDYEAMPGIVFTLKRQSKTAGGNWEDVSSLGTSSNGAVTYSSQSYTMDDGTAFSGYLLNQSNDWDVTFSGLEEGYRYRVEEMGYLTKKDDGTGNLVDVVVPFSSEEFLVNNRYHQTDEMNYEISFAGKTFANLQSIFQQNIPQTENNYGTISIGNLPKAQGYQLGLQKRWYSFTGNGGFANITTGGPSGYYTGQLDGQGARTFIVMQVYQRPYWAFGEHAGEYAGPWVEFNDPIKFNGNEGDTVSPGFPQFNGGTDWHLQINSDTSMAHYGYMKNDQGVYELVYYDYKWIEVSQIPGSDGATYRTYYDGYPDEPEKHSDDPEYYSKHARQEIENYETGFLKLVKDWKLSTDNKANKIFFTVVDDRGNDIAKKVYQSDYKEHYGLDAKDVAYISELGKYVFVVDASDSVSETRWELMIKGLDIVQDVDPETHTGFGEVTYTVEEVGCENQDGTVSAASDAAYPYTASYYTRVRVNGEQYVGNSAAGAENGGALVASGLQLDSGTAYNQSGSLTWARVVNSDEPTTELTVKKKWPGNAYPGTSVKVVLNLEQRRQATDANNTPLWQDEAHTIPQWNGDWQAAEGTTRVSVTLPLSGYSGENAWTYTWKGLPIYKTTGSIGAQDEIEPHDVLWYRVVETSAPGWTSSALTTTGGENIADTGATGDKTHPITEVLTNDIDNTSIHIEKQWTNQYAADEDKSDSWDEDNIVNWPEGYAIDYKVVRHAMIVSATETEATRVDFPEDPNRDADAPTSYEQRNVTYTDGFDVEDWKVDPFLTGQLSAANPSFDLTNQPKGIIVNTGDNPPSGLSRNTTYLVEYVYEVVETAITTPYGTQDVNLPVIPTEGDKVDGVVLGDATIVNDLTNIEVEKLWTLNNAPYTPEGSESVTVQLYRSKERPEGAIPVTPGKITIYVDPMDNQGRKDMADGEIVVTVTGDNGYSKDYKLKGPNYTIETDELPDIAVATGSDITYTVEVKSVDGTVIETATVNGDSSTSVGGRVTLTAKAVTPPQTFKLTFNPNWVIENVWQDGATPPTDESAFANLTLTGDGTRTIRLDNSNQWGKALDLDLRVADDSGDPITYQLTFNNNNDNKNPAFVNEIQNINPNSFTADDATNGTVTVAYKGIAKQQQGGGGGEDIPDGTVKWNYNGDHSETFAPGDTIVVTINVSNGWGNVNVTFTSSEGGSETMQIYANTGNGTGWGEHSVEYTLPDSGYVTLSFNETWEFNSVTVSPKTRAMHAMKAAPRKAAPILRAATPTKSVTIVASGDQTPIDAVAVGDPITLSGGTWSHEWDNLPRVDENGNAIYYYVRELSANIPADVDYAGTTYTYTKHDDEDAREGYSKVTVTNKLEREEPQEGSLVVTKSLSKANTSGGSLTFYIGLFTDSAGTTLAADANVGGANPKAITVANNATSGTVTFAPLTIGTTYYVFETDDSGVKVSTEDKVSGYTIAADDASGKSVVIAAGENTAGITNVYEAQGDAEVQVGKILNGRDLEAEEFSFTLSAQTSGAPLKDADGNAIANLTVGNTAADDGAASTPVSFPTLYYTYDDAGETYVYKIEETIDASATPGVTQDTTDGPETIYARVVVGADNGDGTLAAATVTYWKDADCTEALATPTFVNTYEATGSVDFTQQKTFTNGDAATEFGYTITEYTDDTYATVKSVITDEGTMSQSADGTTTVTYTLSDVGNHYYGVKENLPAGTTPTAADIANGYVIVEGVKYDLTEHQYAVSVSDEGHTGTLTVTKDAEAVEEIESAFTNEQLGQLTVTKSLALDQADPAANTAFQAANADKEYTVVITTGEAPNVKYLAADGTLSDTEVTHTVSNENPLVIGSVPAGTYTVTEQATDRRIIAGYTFDGVTGDPANFQAAIAGGAQTVALTNTYEESETDINIVKVKDDCATGLYGATFTLTKAGGDQTFDAQTTAGGGEAQFTGLKAGSYTLTETAPDGYDGIDGDITFTLTENDGVFTITRTDETDDVELDDSTFTFTVKNHELTDIEVTKEWKDSADGDHTSGAGDTVTFTLYSKTGETTATVAEGLVVTYQADGSYAWSGTVMGTLTAGDSAEKWGTTTITGLPKYASDGTTLIEYYVLETATSEQDVNIETTYKVGASGTEGVNTDATVTDDTDPIVIVNQDVDASTSIKVIKVDAQNNETLADATFSLQRTHDANGAEVEETAVTQTTNGQGEATFGDLQGGTYVLTETDAPAGYETSFDSATFTVSRQGNTMVVSYTDGTNGVVTYDSTNKAFTVKDDAIVDIEAEKTWLQSDNTTELNETLVDAEVTFTLWRQVGEGEWEEASDIAEYQVTLSVDGTADADAWKTGWTGLPKYHGEDLITYKVVESDAEVGGESIDLPATHEAVAEDYDTVAGHDNPTAQVGLTNTLPTTTVTGTKTWQIAGYVPNAPMLKLTRVSAKADATAEDVKDTDGTTDLQPTWEGTGNTRIYTYADLPKYDGEGCAYTYTVTEASFTLNDVTYTVSTEDGETYTVSPDDGKVRVTVYGNSITNTELTTVEATKKWGNLPAEDDTAKSATLTLQRYKGEELDASFGANGAMTGVLTGTAAEAGVTSGELTAWHYTWDNLEKVYWDETANDGAGAYVAYTYKVTESEFTYGEDTYTVTESDGAYTVQLSGENTAAWIVQQGENNDITNTKNDTFIHIAKVWMLNGEVVDGPDDESIKSIDVTLYRVNGEASEVGTYTLTIDPDDEDETHIQPDEAGEWKWTIDGLEKYHIEDDGTLVGYEYYIKETKVDGYTILSYTNGTDTLDDEEDLATASEGGACDVRVTEDGTITVTNSKWSVSLPSTGGAGTTPFYATGVSLLLLAAIWFVWEQRKRAKTD